MRKFNYLLILICLVTAAGTVWIRHENRAVIPQLQARYDLRDNLNIEWRRLLIERTAWMRYEQLENWVRTDGTMKLPDEDFVLLMGDKQDYLIQEENSQ